MSDHMIAQIRLLGESTIAKLASERPRAIVTMHVTT